MGSSRPVSLRGWPHLAALGPVFPDDSVLRFQVILSGASLQIQCLFSYEIHLLQP